MVVLKKLTKDQAAAYLAGMIDGEGHIGFVQRFPRTRGCTRIVTITNTNYELMEACLYCYDLLEIRSKIYKGSAPKPGRTLVWNISVGHREGLEKIWELIPIQSTYKVEALLMCISSYKEHRPLPPREDLETLYASLSLEKIAKKYNCSYKQVWCWFEKHNIPRTR